MQMALFYLLVMLLSTVATATLMLLGLQAKWFFALAILN
jgi:hypothetical protein